MTKVLAGHDIAHRIEQRFPGAVEDAVPEYAVIKSERLLEVCEFLRDEDELDFKYLASLTAVDTLDTFDIVYHVSSFRHNHRSCFKTRTTEREKPVVPSVTGIWPGAHLQERETYDLMGILFDGHEDMRRIFLWDGFAGWPLRKDFLNIPGHMAGLERMPGESREKLKGRGNVDA